LLAISSAATDLIWWWRTFSEIGFHPGNQHLLFCDNKQTVRLLTAEAPKLKTQLKHVDVHQNWLRQEVQKDSITVQWLPTNNQPADGLTKILPRQKHERWMKLLRLTDIKHLID